MLSMEEKALMAYRETTSYMSWINFSEHCESSDTENFLVSSLEFNLFNITFSCNSARFDTSCNLDKWFGFVTMGNSAGSTFCEEEGSSRYGVSRRFTWGWLGAVFEKKIYFGTAGNQTGSAQVSKMLIQQTNKRFIDWMPSNNIIM